MTRSYREMHLEIENRRMRGIAAEMLRDVRMRLADLEGEARGLEFAISLFRDDPPDPAPR